MTTTLKKSHAAFLALSTLIGFCSGLQADEAT